MKTKTKKRMIFLGVAFLICLNSIIPYILIENNVIERGNREKNLPRLSSQDINIITPENNTYIGGMQGYYPATYGFENDLSGADPQDWDAYEELGTIVQVHSELDGHKNFVRLYDNSDINGPGITNSFNPQVVGVIEFWYRITQHDPIYRMIFIQDGDALNSITIQITDLEEIRYFSSGIYQPTGYTLSPNKWHHFKIEFDCTLNWHLWVDGNSVDGGVGYGYRGTPIHMTKLQFIGGSADTGGYNMYIDAVGYSWDSDYTIGDNLNEGLLISYTNNTLLGWVGYSLDGQSFKAINGNTTISTPSDGIHSIQLFGNNTMGTEYHSDIRWFKVEEFSDTYTEDFTTTIYMDDLVSNSSGWGLGEITLPEKNITLSRTDRIGYDLFILGDTAYIGGMQGIYIYDIQNRSEPILLGYNSANTFDCNRIYVLGDYLFGAAGPFGVRVIDVSDPTSISFVTSIDNYYVDTYPLLHDYQDAWEIWALPGSGSSTYVYITDTWHGFVSFLFAEPNTIIQTGGYDPADDFHAISPEQGNLRIEGNIAFCTYGEDILMVDISNRINPVYLNTYNDGDATEMDVSGNLVYFASEMTYGWSYFKILDVTNPLIPVLIYSSPLYTHMIAHISVTNNIACIGYSVEIGTDIFEGHFNTYDITNPSSPVITHSYISPETRYIPGGNWYGVYEIEASGNYAYIFDTTFVIVDLDLIDRYCSSSLAQSTLIYSGSENIVITHAMLISSEVLTQDTRISYYISVDNGTHWEELYTNSIHQFQYIGNNLKWYALLTTSDSSFTPILKYLTIAYLPLINAPSLTNPPDSSQSSDNTPYFEWEDLLEATEYLIQLDTSTNFNSVNYQYQKVSNNYWTASSFLLNGIWYWRVAGIDSKNDVGLFSDYFLIQIDDLAPTCDHPSDIITVFGDNQYIRWTLNDDYGGGSYRVIANNSLGNYYIWRPWQSWTIGERTSIPINRNELGVFNYTIEYYDYYGQYGISDTVLVTINQNDPPTSNHPKDVTTTIEDTETIQWILNDDFGGGMYRIMITPQNGGSSTWIDWTNWDSNVPLNVPIDRTRTGVFNYTIEYRDIYSVYGMADTVKVTIPGEGEGFPLPMLFVIIGGVAIAAVIIPVIYLKRRKN